MKQKFHKEKTCKMKHEKCRISKKQNTEHKKKTTIKNKYCKQNET